MKREANFDTTYCVSTKCKNKCWRHASNFEFEENKDYWLIQQCVERVDKDG